MECKPVRIILSEFIDQIHCHLVFLNIYIGHQVISIITLNVLLHLDVSWNRWKSLQKKKKMYCLWSTQYLTQSVIFGLCSEAFTRLEGSGTCAGFEYDTAWHLKWSCYSVLVISHTRNQIPVKLTDSSRLFWACLSENDSIQCKVHHWIPCLACIFQHFLHNA